MKAVRFHTTGAPEVMVLEEVPTPEAGEGELLLKLEAVGVNFHDLHARSGHEEVPLPFVTGREAAGVVEAVGPGVSGFAVGDRVAFCSIWSTYQEYKAIPAARAIKLPAEIDTRAAAAVTLQGMTAHYLSHSLHAIRPGQTALIHAGAGGTGMLLIQMAKQLGARVFTTVSTEEKAALAQQAGADHAILYTRADFAAEVQRLTDGAGVDVVYDAVAQTTFDKGLEALAPGGTMVLYGAASGELPPFGLRRLIPKGLYLCYGSLGVFTKTTEALVGRAHAVYGMVTRGELAVRIHKTYPLAEAAAAHAELEGRRSTGKMLLIP